jgi:hypothetical protein
MFANRLSSGGADLRSAAACAECPCPGGSAKLVLKAGILGQCGQFLFSSPPRTVALVGRSSFTPGAQRAQGSAMHAHAAAAGPRLLQERGVEVCLGVPDAPDGAQRKGVRIKPTEWNTSMKRQPRSGRQRVPRDLLPTPIHMTLTSMVVEASGRAAGCRSNHQAVSVAVVRLSCAVNVKPSVLTCAKEPSGLGEQSVVCDESV